MEITKDILGEYLLDMTNIKWEFYKIDHYGDCEVLLFVYKHEMLGYFTGGDTWSMGLCIGEEFEGTCDKLNDSDIKVWLRKRKLEKI
jgi:hypothetical protein